MSVAVRARLGLGERARGRGALGRLARRWGQGMRRLLGLRTGIKVDGVYFKELSATPVARALSAKGPGQKEYRVTFRDRSKQVIHLTRRRAYADLVGPARLERYATARDRIRPGMRVLDLGCGTGYTSAWLAEEVGSFGGVVALDTDEEGVRFAQRRYRFAHVAFEVGDASSLGGETDGSFDGVAWVREGEGGDGDGGVLRELWRVLKPGGWLLIGPVAADADPAELRGLRHASEETRGAASNASARGVIVAARSGADVLLVKPAD